MTHSYTAAMAGLADRRLSPLASVDADWRRRA